MNLVAAIPFVANLHPRPESPHRRKILNGELNRLCGCFEATVALPPPRDTPAPSDEKFGWQAVIKPRHMTPFKWLQLSSRTGAARLIAAV
jgi:hypothetical protein